MPLRRSAPLLAIAALLAAWPAAAVESAPAAAVSAGGAFYKLQAGRFVELFGDNTALPAANPVLALDIVPAGQPLQRWVVPGTEGAEFETAPALLFDEPSSTLHLVWNSRAEGNIVSSRLWLRSFGPAGWTEAIDLSGGTIADKRALRLAVTADQYRTVIAGVEAQVSRRVLHLVWIETTDAGATAFYSPIVFLDGQYIGWNPVVRLDDLVTAETASPVPASAALREQPSLEVGRGGDRVMVGFVDSRTLRVATAEVRLLPGELGQLAERARGQIIEYATNRFPQEIPGIAEDARGHIIEYATALHPAMAAYVADGARSFLLGADPAVGLEAFADGARATVLALGDQVIGGGLVNGCAGTGSLLELPPLVPREGADFPQFFELRSVRFWGSPDLPAEASAPMLLVAPDGERVLVGWLAGAQLAYRETLPDGFWSEIHTLDLNQVPFGDAFAALESRLSGR
jgi:hypothetical protein